MTHTYIYIHTYVCTCICADLYLCVYMLVGLLFVFCKFIQDGDDETNGNDEQVQPERSNGIFLLSMCVCVCVRVL